MRERQEKGESLALLVVRLFSGAGMAVEMGLVQEAVRRSMAVKPQSGCGANDAS